MQHRASQRSQSGAVLVVGLVMLLLLTMIGIAAIRDSTFQERMAGNMRDRSLSFQAAEAGLKTAEGLLNGVSALPTFDGNGYGADESGAGTAGYWKDFDWDAHSVHTSLGLLHVKTQPLYYIGQVQGSFLEGMDSKGAVDLDGSMNSGNDTVVYRVTSRSEGGSGDAVVILQSTYRSNKVANCTVCD